MSENKQEMPFKGLGERLKVIRQKMQESTAEVSGAVEIDERSLERIEQGAERPSEDILMLLISHFGMQDDEAASLWQLAGYDQPNLDDDHDHDQPSGRSGNMVLVMAIDPRVVYSDGVQVHANQHGVIVSFAQTGAPQPLVTSKVGMSREQAKNVIRALQEALQKSEPRQLPHSTEGDN